MRRRAALGLAAMLVILSAPAAAHAAVVKLVRTRAFGSSTPSDYYHGARFISGKRPDGKAEVNHLTITFDRDLVDPEQYARVTFHDPGAVIDARSGCIEVDAHTASCSDSHDVAILSADAYLGPGDDSLTTAHPQGFSLIDVRAHGGRGDDTLNGGPEDEELDGGGGHDSLFGGDGRDTLADGDRSGAPGDAGPNSDLLDGGPGVDTISYAGRKRSVTADVASGAPTGEKGENDDARSYESVIGGSGDDRLYGDDGENHLDGRGGSDLLVGRGGGDGLSGGSGRDRLHGGPGGDSLAPGRGRDSITCDGDSDVVVTPQPGEVLGLQCEEVFFSSEGEEGPNTAEFDPHPQTSRRHVDFDIPCSEDLDGGTNACSGTVRLRKAFGRHRLLGSARFDRSFDEEDTLVRVRLTRLGRRLIARRKGVVATAFLRGSWLPHGAWTVRIKR